MDFAGLKPGDEITVRLGNAKETCRAQVREPRPGLVIGVFWNSAAQRIGLVSGRVGIGARSDQDQSAAHRRRDRSGLEKGVTYRAPGK
jgi:hypothetical protein